MDKGGYMKKEPEEMKKINLKHSPGIENLKAILEASKTSKEGEHKMQDFIEKNTDLIPPRGGIFRSAFRATVPKNLLD